MLVTKSVVIGLVSLGCTANATKATSKPVLAKRQATVTVTNNGCTAVCYNVSNVKLWAGPNEKPEPPGSMLCEVSCDGGLTTQILSTPTPTSPSKSISTSTVTSTVTSKAALEQRMHISTTEDGCTASCTLDEEEGDWDCSIHCEGNWSDSSTSMPNTFTSTPTVTSTTQAALEQRTVITATNGDCTAVCWNLMPGTECDVQCSSDFKTEMPGNVAHPSGANSSHHLAVIFQAQEFSRPHLLQRSPPTLLPSKAARIANLEARENVQAHKVHEARLARKFGGIVARDDGVTVTVTSIPESCTAGPESSILTTLAGIPTILPMQVPQEAGASDISAALSQASAALSAVQKAQGGAIVTSPIPSAASSLLSELSSVASAAISEASALPPAASSALSEASALLSSAAATPPISANATIATPGSAGSAPTVSATITAASTSSETTTQSTTTTGSPVVSEAGTAFSTSILPTGAAPEYTVSSGLVLSLLVGLAANVAFLI